MARTWVVAYANPNILDLIEAMGADYRLAAVPAADVRHSCKRLAGHKYRGRLDNPLDRHRSAGPSSTLLTNCSKSAQPRGVQHDRISGSTGGINCGSSSIKFFRPSTPPAATACSTAWPRHQRERASLASTAASRWALAQRGYEGALQAIAGA